MTLPKYLIDPNPELYLTDNYLVLDFEADNTDDFKVLSDDCKLVLSCWWYQGERKSIRGGKYDIAELHDDLAKADVLVAQNGKFEFKWLDRSGFDIGSILLWDTMIAEKVLLGNLSKPLDLGSIAKRYGMPGKEPFVDKQMKRGVLASDISPRMLKQRCDYDVIVTRNVFLKQRQRVAEEGKLGVVFTRCILTPVLADIEGNGLQLDAAKVEVEYQRATREYNKVNRELEAMSPGINWNSGKQVAEFVYGELGFKELTHTFGKNKGEPIRTDAGAPKTDKDTIAALKPRTKQQRAFIELYQQQSKLNAELTKALSKFKACVDKGELLYASFSQVTTKTHRLASNGIAPYNVQFQNLAREFKKLFASRYSMQGWKFAEIDGAQLEFRVAAFLGQDERAVTDIREGFDVHRFTASVLNSCKEEDVTKAQRQGAKADTFKPLYGGQSGTPQQVKYYEAFKAKYLGIAAIQEKWKLSALASDKVRTVTGLEFFYPNTKLVNGYVTNSTNICNYPVQSLATADIIPIALTYLWHETRGMESFLVNTVHDSALLELHPDEEDAVYEIAVDCFTTKVYNFLYTVYGIKFNVPLGTGFTAGTHWSVGEERTTQVEPPEFKDG